MAFDQVNIWSNPSFDQIDKLFKVGTKLQYSSKSFAIFFSEEVTVTLKKKFSEKLRILVMFNVIFIVLI